MTNKIAANTISVQRAPFNMSLSSTSSVLASSKDSPCSLLLIDFNSNSWSGVAGFIVNGDNLPYSESTVVDAILDLSDRNGFSDKWDPDNDAYDNDALNSG